MDKAQIQVMPFIYIFALVVGALILVFGLKYAFSLQASGEQIELGRFRLDVEREVSFIYNLDTGSSSEVKLKTPTRIRSVCFTNPEKEVRTTDQQFRDLLFLKPKDNFFIISEDPSQDKSFYVENLKSDTNPFCIQPKGELKVIFENKGTYVTPAK